MPIYALGDLTPSLDPSAYIHPDAIVIGDVVMGPDSSVWPGAVVRGDSSRITIGARTSIQDNAVLHCAVGRPTTVGADCTIGHLVHLEGCTIEDRCLIGVGAVVLHLVVVRTGAIVAANAVVLDGTEVPAGALALGVPARIREGAADAERIADGSASYVPRTRQYREMLRRIG